MISSLQHTFAGIIVITRDERPVEEQLLEYEHWEKYDPLRTYSKVGQSIVTGSGVVREYYQYLLILTGPDEQELYVVSREDQEIKSLESYCPCSKCQASYLNPLKYIWCDHCTRCLRTGKQFTDPTYLAQAKVKRELARKHVPKAWVTSLFRSIKQVELITALMIVIVAAALMYW